MASTNEEQEDRSAVREFLDAIPKEGDDISMLNKVTEDETSSESSTENKDDKETQAAPETKQESDENIPFHKHPRFKQLVEERKELREKVSTYEQRLNDLENRFTHQSHSAPEIPSWFVHLYGDNAEAWQLYSEYTITEKERIKNEAVQELRQSETQAAKRQEEMDNWVSENIQSLKDDGHKFDENKLLKILVDYSPTDKQGNIDFGKGLEILQKLEKVENIESIEKSKAKKEIAAHTTSSVEGNTKSKKVMTAKDLRKMSWQDLIDS